MGRSPCCEKAHTNKGAWSKQEDETLIAYIQAHGEGCWRTLPKNAGLQRCGKSCRLRWINYLRPDLKRGNFTLEEDELIIKLHSILGNKWSLIAGKLPGRTDNEIKNYWNTHIKKKLLERGVDPYTHRPITRSASDSSSSNDTNCHVPMATSAESATTSFTDFFQQQHTVSHFLFPSSSSTSAGADQDVVNSSYHADNGDNKNHNSYDLNLDLSITLPYSSMEKGTISVVENNFGSEADTKQKSHVCFHIGLSCSSCSG